MRCAEALRQKAFEALYEAGWSDTLIAMVLRAGVTTIQGWRLSRGLPENANRRRKIVNDEARRMYEEGALDPKIAKRFGVGQSAVVKWRQRCDLSPNYIVPTQLSEAEKRQARKMLRLGATLRQVADAIGRTGLTGVARIRAAMRDKGVRPTGRTNLQVRAELRREKGITERIERAIGKGVPLEVRMEATSALFLAVYEGLVSIDYIEAVAPSYRNRAYELCGSKFGPRSLDEQIGDDGWTLMDSLDDPSALEAVEAAGEAAWDDLHCEFVD